MHVSEGTFSLAPAQRQLVMFDNKRCVQNYSPDNLILLYTMERRNCDRNFLNYSMVFDPLCLVVTWVKVAYVTKIGNMF